MADKDASPPSSVPVPPLKDQASPGADEMTARVAAENVRPFSEQFERDLTSVVVPVAIVATFALWSFNFRRAAPVTAFLGNVSQGTTGLVAALVQRARRGRTARATEGRAPSDEQP
jgi:hypothetical protein